MSNWYVLAEDGKTPVRIPDIFEDPEVHVAALQASAERQDRHVAKTTIGDVLVSTVFFQLDHRDWGTTGPPVLWETMVFGGALDMECERYTSRADAEAGHAEMVRRVREAGQ